VDFETYFKAGYPSNALDVAEQFYFIIGNYAPDYREKAFEFQHEVNEALTDFRCSWRLSDGQFFKIESEFLESEIVQQAEDRLKKHGFAGSLDEFRSAREDLSGTEYRDAITKACQSVESSLKTVTDTKTGDINKLLERFFKLGFLDDLREDKRRAIYKPIFQGLAVLRNEIGSHGQGKDLVKVEQPYAALAVRFGGALNQFVIDQYLRKKPPEQKPEAPESDEPDDIPF
jgi:hypothetical protein